MKRSLFHRTLAIVMMFLTAQFTWGWHLPTVHAAGEWTWVNPSPQGERLGRVIYAGDQFIALGDRQTILTSKDGTTWALRRSALTGHLNDVVYANGRYTAVGVDGERGLMLTSLDGLTWSDLGVDFPPIYSIAHGNGQYLLTIPEQVGFRSTDGLTWEPWGQGPWFAAKVVFGADRFVANGDGNFAHSLDGANWTRTDLCCLDGLAYADGTFTGMFYQGFATSSDGIAWRVGKRPPYTIYGGGTAYLNGAYFAWERGNMWRSVDTETWTHVRPGDNDGISDVAFGGGAFVAVGRDGLILSSIDGETWVERSTFQRFLADQFVTVNDTYFALGREAYGDPGSVYISSNGREWTVHPAPPGRQIQTIASDGSRFVVAGARGTILSSNDGHLWVDRTTRTDVDWYSATAGGGVFLAWGSAPVFGAIPVVALSTDGATWEYQSLPEFVRVDRVVYAGGQFFALGYGFLLTSPDGREWTKHALDIQAIVRGVTYGDGQYVAVTETRPCGPTTVDYTYCSLSAVLRSSDGARWSITSVMRRDLKDVAYGTGEFRVIDSLLNSLVSRDLTTWRSSALVGRILSNVKQIQFTANQFVVLGSNGSIWRLDGGCAGFWDVSSATSSCGALDLLRTRSVITGLSDGSVNPYGRVTRAEMAKMLTVAMGWSLEPGAQMPFSDLNGHWAQTMGYLQPALAHQALQGMGDGTFQPDGLLTRSQVIKIAAAAMGLAPSGTPPYSDVPSGHWSGPWIGSAAAAKLVGADAPFAVFLGDRLDVERPATREEAAMVIANLLKHQP